MHGPHEAELDILLNEYQHDPALDQEDDGADAGHELGIALPTRMAFCTTWTLSGETLEIVDEFTSVEANVMPLVIGDVEPLFLAIFWSGLSVGLKATLEIRTPSGVDLRVLLPALKPRFETQVQMNSLRGFRFEEPGQYNFTVSAHEHRMTTTLTVISSLSYSVEFGD